MVTPKRRKFEIRQRQKRRRDARNKSARVWHEGAEQLRNLMMGRDRFQRIQRLIHSNSEFRAAFMIKYRRFLKELVEERVRGEALPGVHLSADRITARILAITEMAAELYPVDK